MAASREWAVLGDEVAQLLTELREIRGEFGGINFMAAALQNIAIPLNPQNGAIQDVETQKKIVAQIEKIVRFLEREANEHQAEFKTEIQHTTIFDRLIDELCSFPGYGIVWSIWDMENSVFYNSLQWLPRETLSDTISLYSPLSEALPDFLSRLSKLWAVFNITPISDQEKFARLLSAAVQHDNRTLIDFLISWGAKLDARTYHRTPLEAARAYDNKEMVEFLLDRGADPNKKSYEARHKELHTVIEKGVNITANFFLVTYIGCAFLILYQMVSDKTMDNVSYTEKGMKVMSSLLAIVYMIAHLQASKEFSARVLADLATQSLMGFEETRDNVSHFINNPLNSIRDNALSIVHNPLNGPLDRFISPEIRLDVGRNVNSFFSRLFPNLGLRNNNGNQRGFDRFIGDIVVVGFIPLMMMFFAYVEALLQNDSDSPSPVPNPLAAARMT